VWHAVQVAPRRKGSFDGSNRLGLDVLQRGCQVCPPAKESHISMMSVVEKRKELALRRRPVLSTSMVRNSSVEANTGKL
jgi:hypothetical protein